MKQFILFFFLTTVFIAHGRAQDSTPVHHIYHAKLTLLNAEEVKGYLAEISDSALFISSVTYTPPQNYAEEMFNPSKGAVIAAAGLTFAAIGTGVGALIGSHHDKYLINGEWKNLQEIKEAYQYK